MKYRAALGNEHSFIKRNYEQLVLEQEGVEKIIELCGGIENVYSKIIYMDKADQAFFGICRVEREDEYEYLFFCKKDLDPKEEFFGDFTKEITEEEFFAICEKEEIELGEAE